MPFHLLAHGYAPLPSSPPSEEQGVYRESSASNAPPAPTLADAVDKRKELLNSEYRSARALGEALNRIQKQLEDGKIHADVHEAECKAIGLAALGLQNFNSGSELNYLAYVRIGLSRRNLEKLDLKIYETVIADIAVQINPRIGVAPEIRNKKNKAQVSAREADRAEGCLALLAIRRHREQLLAKMRQAGMTTWDIAAIAVQVANAQATPFVSNNSEARSVSDKLAQSILQNLH